MSDLPPQPGLDAPATAAAGDAAPTAGASTVVARGRRRWLAPVALLTALILLLGGGFLFFRGQISDAVHGVNRQQLMPSTNTSLDGAQTFLLAGTDSRDPAADPGNSDTLMIGYVPADRAHAYLISIPRDLWVKIHGGRYAKINAAYAQGGVPLTVSTLDDLFGGSTIRHAAIVNFFGFMAIIDNLGGVDIDNPYATESVGNVFPAGRIHLNGDQALNYVRERKELENGDLDRTGRQRAVIKAIVQKALSAGVLSDPSRAKAFLKQFAGAITVDQGLSDDALTNFLLSLKLTSADDIRSIMLPIGGYATAYDGEAIDVADPQQVSDLAAALRNGTMDQWWAAHSGAPVITGNLGPDTWSDPSPGRPRTPRVTQSTADPSGSAATATASARRSPTGGLTTGYGTHPTTGPTHQTSR